MKIRPAVSSDASLIAWTILAALDIDDYTKGQFEAIKEFVLRDDVLYSWVNTLVSEENGVATGALVCYDGARYQTLRKVTFPLMAEVMGNDFSTMEMETEAGEFYIDSLAVLPEYRGCGFAVQLIKAAVEKAKLCDVQQVSLVVSPEKPKVQQLYESCGFTYHKDMFLFGESFSKMIYPL